MENNKFISSRIWVLTLGVVNTFVLSVGVFNESPTMVFGAVGLAGSIVLALIVDAKEMAKDTPQSLSVDDLWDILGEYANEVANTEGVLFTENKTVIAACDAFAEKSK